MECLVSFACKFSKVFCTLEKIGHVRFARLPFWSPVYLCLSSITLLSTVNCWCYDSFSLSRRVKDVRLKTTLAPAIPHVAFLIVLNKARSPTKILPRLISGKCHFNSQGSYPRLCFSPSPESEASFELKDMDVPTLLKNLQETNFSKEVVLALERCLCDESVCPEGNGTELLPDREHFLMLMKTLEQLGAEKTVQMGMLR